MVCYVFINNQILKKLIKLSIDYFVKDLTKK